MSRINSGAHFLLLTFFTTPFFETFYFLKCCPTFDGSALWFCICTKISFECIILWKLDYPYYHNHKKKELWKVILLPPCRCITDLIYFCNMVCGHFTTLCSKLPEKCQSLLGLHLHLPVFLQVCCYQNSNNVFPFSNSEVNCLVIYELSV